MTPYEKAMLALARKFYPVKFYADASNEQLLRWLAEDATKAALKRRPPTPDALPRF